MDMEEEKSKALENESENDEEENIMAANIMSRNFVYTMKTTRDSSKKEPTITEEMIKEAKKSLSKYERR